MMYTEISKFEELHKLLNIGSKLGPSHRGARFIRLTCGQNFEPHGRASETWELEWILEFPHIVAHWKHITHGWLPIVTSQCMSFHGRTSLDVIQKGIQFLNECPNPQEIKSN